MTPASLTAVARHLLFIRETLGPNRGYWVEFLQRFAGGVPGDPWCADFVSLVLDIAYRGQSPLRKTGSTQVLFREATLYGWQVPVGAGSIKDDLYFFVHDDGTPHHVGIVTVGNAAGLALTGIAGNTSEDGRSAEGTGAFEHALSISQSHLRLVRLPQ